MYTEEKINVDNERHWLKSKEHMGHARRQLSSAHELVLIKMAQEEVIEGFEMSCLNHTKTLWKEWNEKITTETRKGQRFNTGLHGVNWKSHYRGARHMIEQPEE